jgi:hypothetical protein
MIDRDRTFHPLMAATRRRKAEDRHAREALAQDNLYPRIAAAFCEGSVGSSGSNDTPDRDFKE